VVDARHSGYPADRFVDGIHVNRRGALELSAALAEAIQGRPTSGWVALGDGRARPVDLPIEDVSESAVALAGGGSRVN
jgi:hypothetical protein